MSGGEVVEVAESEHALLSIARAVVGELPPRAVSSVLLRKRKAIQQMDARSLDLLKQTLAIGVPLTLVRRGGFRRTRHVGDSGVVTEQRAFERNELSLHFGEETFRLLAHLVASDVSQAGLGGSKLVPTLGDQLVTYLAADVTRAVAAPRGARLTRSALCWFGHLRSVARTAPKSAPPLMPLVECPAVIESLSPDWATRWVACDRGKASVITCDDMIALGHTQQLLLESYFDAIDAAGRRDLARFFVQAVARLIKEDEDPLAWAGSLKLSKEPLSRRAEAYHAAATSYFMIERVARWATEAGAVHFIDDDYDQAQLFLSIWEEVGEEGLAVCRERVSALEDVHSA